MTDNATGVKPARLLTMQPESCASGSGELWDEISVVANDHSVALCENRLRDPAVSFLSFFWSNFFHMKIFQQALQANHRLQAGQMRASEICMIYANSLLWIKMERHAACFKMKNVEGRQIYMGSIVPLMLSIILFILIMSNLHQVIRIYPLGTMNHLYKSSYTSTF